MKTIHKYPLDPGSVSSFFMPKDAVVLCVQVQANHPCIWAVVDPDAPTEMRHFRIYGTGHEIVQDGTYIGTFQLDHGSLVFHVFEVHSRVAGIRPA